MKEPRDDAPTPAERAALDALPREREPGRLLEERTVRALRTEGLLSAPARRSARVPAWAAAAAAVAIFAGGLSLGQWMGGRAAAETLAEAQRVHEARSARDAALQVQRTGSAYVTALATLARVAEADTSAAAREVATRLLRAAADEVLRIAPDDPVAAGILTGERRARPDSAATAAATVWF